MKLLESYKLEDYTFFKQGENKTHISNFESVDLNFYASRSDISLNKIEQIIYDWLRIMSR